RRARHRMSGAAGPAPGRARARRPGLDRTCALHGTGSAPVRARARVRFSLSLSRQAASARTPQPLLENTMRTMTMGLVCVGLAWCGSGEVKYTEGGGDPEGNGDGGSDDIAVAGTWLDSFGITNTITSETWGWQYPGYPDENF